MAEEDLAGIKIKDSYEGLLHLSDGGLSVTPGLGEVKPVYDGQGRQTCLNLASNMLSIEGVAAGFAIDSTGNADYGFIDQGTSGTGIGLRGSTFYDGTQSSDLFVANSGDVGIGTESPGSMLSIKGNGSTKWGSIAIDGDGSGNWGFIDQGVLGTGIGLRGQGEQLGLQECDLYVSQGGNVGIGTESPGKKLHIVGEMRYEFGTPAAGQVLACTNANGDVAWSSGTVVEQGAGSAPYYGCRAWAYYDGINNVLEASGNIASVTQGTGRVYTFTFTTPMPDTNYAVVVGSTNFGVFGTAWVNVVQVKNRTTTTFEVEVEGSGPDGGETHQRVSVAVFK